METSNVPIVDLPQATPSVSGSIGGVPFSRSTEPQFSLAQPQTALRGTATQSTAMPSMVSPSAMTARPNQLGLMSAPLNIQGTQLQGAYAHPRLAVFIKGVVITKSSSNAHEHQEFQKFQAWNLVPTQPQSPCFMDLTEPPVNIDAPVEVNPTSLGDQLVLN